MEQVQIAGVFLNNQAKAGNDTGKANNISRVVVAQNTALSLYKLENYVGSKNTYKKSRKNKENSHTKNNGKAVFIEIPFEDGKNKKLDLLVHTGADIIVKKSALSKSINVNSAETKNLGRAFVDSTMTQGGVEVYHDQAGVSLELYVT